MPSYKLGHVRLEIKESEIKKKMSLVKLPWGAVFSQRDVLTLSDKG